MELLLVAAVVQSEGSVPFVCKIIYGAPGDVPVTLYLKKSFKVPGTKSTTVIGVTMVTRTSTFISESACY